MKSNIIAFFLLVLSLSAIAQQKNGVERPKLVVGVVIDQMRWDYLYRYYERYGNGGFKRLMKDGFSCEQAMINYLPAYTAPGHACIYTGSVPSIHGIAGNDWFDNLTGKYTYCTGDTSVRPVSGSRAAGRMSPKNLLATTVTDELRLATNFKSRVFGFSIKDRGAIIPAGHLANGAYWYDDSTGNMMSSSYYGNELPGWLQAFNNRHLPDSFLAQKWETLYPGNTYHQSLNDDNKYEGSFQTALRPVFPHLNGLPKRYGNLRRIPAGNTFILNAAKACINGEALGNKGATDFLCVSLSSTDYIGHQFTPNSIEVEDTYLRLDRELAEFMTYLDGKVGKGNYLLFLTADHGGAHNATYMSDINIPAGNDNETAVSNRLKQFVRDAFNKDSLVVGMENYQVVLSNEKIKAANIDLAVVKQRIRGWFEEQSQVAYVIDMDDLGSTPVPELIMKKAINGYNRLRSGSMLVVYNPGWYMGYSPTGTTHGTWHPYDAHLPLLWYGWKISKGSTNRIVYMEDIAATIAAMLHIQMPNGCIGTVITEIVK